MGRPNVIWVTIESTRADHTSVSGFDRGTTPNLRRMADRESGRSFEQCSSHSIWTLPSSASILTGTYPSRHGAGVGGEAIPEDLPTVPERFRDAGYHTACLAPNSHVSAATGLDRGFEQFSWVSRSTLPESVGVRTLLKFLVSVRRHGAGLTTDTRKHGSGYMITDAAKRWLRSFEGRQEPFFFYVFYGEPHHPYYPPLSYLSDVAADRGTTTAALDELAMRHHDDLHDHIAAGVPFTDEEWAALHALYDAEIAYVDSLVGDLYDYVHDLDVGETVFVVTADHGEFFGEQGLLAHIIAVDDAVTHVPLVVAGHDGMATHDGEVVQHADVMRTLLEDADADTDGVQGIDLQRERREYSIIQRGHERYERNVRRLRELNPDFETGHFHEGLVTALRTPEYKYVSGADGDVLYRLPDETTDVAADHPAVADDMQATLSEWLEREGQPAGERAGQGRFTDAMKDQLRDLGYLVD